MVGSFRRGLSRFAGGKSGRSVFALDQRKGQRSGTVQPVLSGEAEPNPGGLVTE
jgi:hypothetical protein